MTSNNVFDVFDLARDELDRIAGEIDEHIDCSHTACRVQYPTETLRVLVDLIEQIDTRSPVRYRLSQAVLSGLNISSTSVGPTPPGVVLVELMRTNNMTIKALADLTGRSTKNINDLRTGHALPTNTTALLLEQAGLGTAAEWNRITSDYRTWLLRQKKENT